MNFNQERYFFLSGIISFSFFLLLLFLISYSVILTPKIQQFAMVQSDVINVSIALSEVKASKESVSEPKIQPQSQKTEEKVEPVTQPPERVPEISDLFAQVKPDKAMKKESEDPKRLEQLNALEKEVSNRKEISRISDKVNKLELAKPSVKMVAQGGSTGPLVDKYYATIQGLVYANFHPSIGTEGEVSRVRMKISASGKLIAYKVITYGKSGTFNSEVDWLKDRLSSIRFPEHPDGKEAVLEFILTAKE
jgi:periplasmic protein TonB